MSDVQQRIDDLVKGNRVVLFMKGTAQFPQCGFSGRAVQILKACGVTAAGQREAQRPGVSATDGLGGNPLAGKLQWRPLIKVSVDYAF